MNNEDFCSKLLMPIIQIINKQIPDENPVVIKCGCLLIVFLTIFTIYYSVKILNTSYTIESWLFNITKVMIMLFIFGLIFALILGAMFPQGL